MKDLFPVFVLAAMLAPVGCEMPAASPGAQSAPNQPKAASGLEALFKPPAAKPQTGPSDVMKVVCFYRPNPFLSFDPEGDPDPEGFTFTLFLISKSTSKGVLEEGTLAVRMFRSAEGRSARGTTRELVREWTVETRTLVQSSKPHPLFGMGYQPQFAWEKSDNVIGRDIEVIAAFTARDGRTIQSQTKSLRVPGSRVQ